MRHSEVDRRRFGVVLPAEIVIVAVIPGRSSGLAVLARLSTSARTRYLLPAWTSGLMKTTCPAKRAVRRAGKLHLDGHRPAGDFDRG